ncbi:MAG: hypothetical protein M1835_004851 [Candelina submexicana]|nr:MAG: hypothetical protein M1835_004851 [Candelina submexicana]
MSYSARPLSSNLRHPPTSNLQNSTGQSPVLLARINEKKAELEDLKQLRDLSGGLAGQMQMLEEKLATLADGTEVKIPSPKAAGGESTEKEPKKSQSDVPLPQTLVRIPTAQPSTAKPHATSSGENDS